MGIYLDSAATTKPFEEIIINLPKITGNYFANPNSIHSEGQKVKNEIEKVRFYIADILNTDVDNIIFTSCATESNNTVIKSLLTGDKKKDEIIISPIEHKSVLNPAKFLSKNGFKIKFLKINENGVIDLDDLRKKISLKTALVAVIHGNNETGVIQNIKKIGKICKEKEVLFFSDTVQSFLKESIDTDFVDFISVSGHKLNGLKGIGFLFKKRDITPLLHGGGQENGIRSGTQNTTGILSLKIAIKKWEENKQNYIEHIKFLRDKFEKKLQERIPDITIVSKEVKRLPHISNIIFPKVDAQSLLMALSSRGIYVSSGSACSSGTPTPSHVLLSYGYSEDEALRSLRFSFGVHNSLEEIEKTIDILVNTFENIYKFY